MSDTHTKVAAAESKVNILLRITSFQNQDTTTTAAITFTTGNTIQPTVHHYHTIITMLP